MVRSVNIQARQMCSNVYVSGTLAAALTTDVSISES